jgi:aminoglycoside phosphotransferase
MLAGVLRVLTGQHDPATIDLRQPRTSAKAGVSRVGQGGSVIVFTGAEAVRDLAAQACAWRDSLSDGGHIVVVVENQLRVRLVWVRHRMRRLIGLESQAGDGGRLRGPNLKEVQAALRAAGLACKQVLSVYPSTRRPRTFFPLAGRQDLLAPGHLLVACRTGQPEPTPLEALLSQVQQAGRAQEPATYWRVLKVSASEKHKSIVFIGDEVPRVVIRVSHSAAAREAETHAYGLLQHLRSRPEVSQLVPEPVCAGQIAGEPYFAERAMPGASLAKVVRLDKRATYLPMVESFLVALNSRPAAQQEESTQALAASQFAAPVMARVLPLVQDAALRERTAALLEHSLAGAVYRPGLLHGDYGVSNILVSEARLSGVIDWENAQHAAPSVLDAFNYLDSVHRWCTTGLTLADTVPMLARGEWPIPEELAMLRRAMARDGIPERYLRGFALLYWMRHLSAQLEFQRSNEALTQRVRDLLSRLPD